MQRDTQAVEEILELANIGEAVCLISIKDTGKDIVFRIVEEKIKDEKIAKTHKIFIHHVFVKEDLEEIIQKQAKVNEPRVLLLNLNIDEDIPFFFQKLNELRFIHSADFVPIIFTHHLEVKTALEAVNKVVVRGLLYLSPVDENDANTLLSDFERRFKAVLAPTQRKKIIEFSSGHVGLLKSLYVLTTKDSQIIDNIDQLLQNEQILYRLKEMTSALSESDISALYIGKLPHFQSLVYKKLGYLKNGEIFSRLLKKYILLEHLIPSSWIEKNLTNQELILYTLLKENLDEVVSRVKIISLIWQGENAEKYSEWALDKLIQRLREKINQFEPKYTLETKKGRGIVLSNS